MDLHSLKRGRHVHVSVMPCRHRSRLEQLRSHHISTALTKMAQRGIWGRR
ncbi:hypothetical protein L916_00618 [Phytophthora nicotianae]|uniref:Uncharacterized protein n=1 Tax=Phytophthora nicotianae TaxID=4792 RepID=W2JWE2_PHYNI|nr:hypothetical protein L916_00618 [Phytophthora nicotianae]